MLRLPMTLPSRARYSASSGMMSPENEDINADGKSSIGSTTPCIIPKKETEADCDRPDFCKRKGTKRFLSVKSPERR